MRAPNRSSLALLAAVAALALAIVAVGCGGDGDNGDNSAGGGGGIYGGGGTKTTASGGGSGVVSVANNPKLGQILVDDKGMTLYLFEKDKGGKSSCSGACAATWPPLTTSGQPKPENGAKSSLISTTKRDDGTTQVVYNNWPLYTYVADQKPGDTTGHDLDQFGAEWYALTPAGVKAKD